MNRAVTGRMKRRLFLTRERYENGPSCTCSPHSDQTILVRRVFRIGGNAGTVGEKGFDLRNRKAMLLTLRPVTFIPIEPTDPQIHHSATYTNVYTFIKAGHELKRGPGLVIRYNQPDDVENPCIVSAADGRVLAHSLLTNFAPEPAMPSKMLGIPAWLSPGV